MFTLIKEDRISAGICSRLTNIVKHYTTYVLGETRSDTSFVAEQPPTTAVRDLAEWFERQPVETSGPDCYNVFKAELKQQAQMLFSFGYTSELVEEDPYDGVEGVVRSIRDQQHLSVLSTQAAGSFPGDHPLCKQSSFVGSNGNALLYNDLFRWVHDMFGHGHLGADNAPFTLVGEWRSWRMHRQMFSDKAKGALAAETIAQISWMESAPPFDGDPRPVSDRPFPKQKVVSVPWALRRRLLN